MSEIKNVPRLRFPGFTEPWEQRKLGELCSEIGDGLHSAPIYDENGEYYFINGNNLVNGKIVIDTTETNRVSKETFMKNDKSLDDKTILLSINGTIGNLAYYGDEKVMLGKSAAYLKAQNIAKEFLYASLQTSIVMDSFMLSLTGTTIKNLGLEAIKNTKIYIPRIKEQQQIGTYFKNLDHLITLHQRKLDHVRNLKKSMLQKMFPKNGKLYPEIRFPGFTDAWEQRKLGEILIGLQNNTLSRADLSNETGVAKNVHYGDVLIKFGEVLDVSKEKLPMISDESILSKYKSSFLQNGDVIVADTAEDSTVGKCSEIAGLNDEIVLSGLHTIPYRPIEKFASGYLGYYLNSSAYHNQLIPLMQGIKVTSISKSAMQDTDIVYPKSVEEQGKIGDYFQSLDNLITLHQRELDHLKLLKNGMLQQMFV